MISHRDVPHDPDSPEAFIFAELGGFTCSVCAPISWSKEQVEAFAGKRYDTDGWQSINTKDLFGQKDRFTPTPNPCNQAPSKRTHHFCMRNP